MSTNEAQPMNAIRYWFDRECEFYEHRKFNPDIKTVAAEAWAILEVANREGDIDWDSQRLLFGEFMSKYLNLRV